MQKLCRLINQKLCIDAVDQVNTPIDLLQSIENTIKTLKIEENDWSTMPKA